MKKELLKYKSYNALIKYFFKEYSSKKSPIPVSFKELFPNLNNIERYSHLIHSYPAKLLAHIPHFFLNNDIFSRKGDFVLDPFCGTGTVLLEAMVAGRNSFGADSNPLAQLIAEVKTKKINQLILEPTLKKIIHKAKIYKRFEIPEVVNRDLWFSQNTQIKLSKLLKSIKSIEDSNIRNFFLVCFSNCIKKVSYADPRVAVPVKLNPKRFSINSKERIQITKKLIELEDIDVFTKFHSVSLENILRINKLNEISEDVSVEIISDDARNLTVSKNSNLLLNNESVDLIITSPPYAGAQKYIRSSSLNLGWLEFVKPQNLKHLDKNNIGRENYLVNELNEVKTDIVCADKLLKKISLINKKRAYIVGNYLNEMKVALSESLRVLKKDGYFIMIIGNNKVCNMEFNTQKYFTEYLEKKGLQLQFKLIDDIKSYGLMTKRNKTADIISREWILVFKK